MSGSKLVENLAESLVNELSESKTLDLMNDAKFSEFTDLLWEILDRQDKAEDREKEKEEKEKQESENEKEVTDSVKALAEKITEYFGKGGDKGGSADGKTDKILKIVQNLQNDGKESGESDDEKKKKKLTLGKKTKEQKELEETKEKKEEEKKEEEKAQLDKKTVQMLAKLSKDFEKSEKERKKQNSFVRKGLKRVERKIGSLLWKALNKFKGILLIGALIFFRKPIMKLLGKIWDEYLKPYVAPLIFSLGEKLGNLWEDIKGWIKDEFPELTDWIKNEYPKVKTWFKNNWEKVKDWFVNTFPQIPMVIDKFLDLPIIRNLVATSKIDTAKENFNNNDAILNAQARLDAAEALYHYREAAGMYDNNKSKTFLVTGEGQMDVITGKKGLDSNWGFETVTKENDKQTLENLRKNVQFQIKREDWINRAVGVYNTKTGKWEGGQYTPLLNQGATFSDADNTQYPEYGNVVGGMGGQYNASDVDSGKNTNLIDNSHQGMYIFPVVNNNNYISQKGDSLITPP